MPTILCFSGSTRRDSVNTKLLRIAARGVEQGGATPKIISLADYPMPIYDGDLEEKSGVPESAMRLKAAMHESAGYLIACPEYNSSITPLLKNAIDWASRPVPNEAPHGPYRGKPAGLVAASPGNFGGYRGLMQVRWILQNILIHVHPNMFALPGAFGAFDETGNLKDAKHTEAAMGVGKSVAQLAVAMKAMR